MLQLQSWFDKHVKWSGNQYTNSSSRRGNVPLVIVNHMTTDTIDSCISWFRDKKNNKSSSHFAIAKSGAIHQFVKIENSAWANGLSVEDAKKSLVPIIQSKGINPNWISVSIEYENFREEEGQLTIEQVNSGVYLIKYIIEYVKFCMGHEVVPSRGTILLHSDIDPVRKHFCAGAKFPILSLISKLDRVFLDIGDHWAEEQIKLAYKKGWVKGYPDGTFKPDRAITRAEVVAMLIEKEKMK